MAKPEKVAAVEEVKSLFAGSSAALLTEYRGLTVQELMELRRALGENTKYRVVKNTLAEIAAHELGIDAFDGQLKGPSAIAFIEGEPVEAAKALRDFSQAHPALVVKSGYFEGAALSAEQVEKLADMESREVLLSKTAGSIKAAISKAVIVAAAPLSKAARTVDALRAKQEEAA
jgi:large subunit ribosomal protein L10